MRHGDPKRARGPNNATRAMSSVMGVEMVAAGWSAPIRHQTFVIPSFRPSVARTSSGFLWAAAGNAAVRPYAWLTVCQRRRAIALMTTADGGSGPSVWEPQFDDALTQPDVRRAPLVVNAFGVSRGGRSNRLMLILAFGERYSSYWVGGWRPWRHP